MGLRIQASIPKGSVIIGRLKGIKNASNTEMQEAVTEIFEESIKILRVYPPETGGNSPPPPYYERGVGMYNRYGNLRENRLSGDLKEQWSYEVSSTDSGVTGTIQNDAFNPGHVPYAGYVHGSETNDPPQTMFHGAHGWPVAKDVIEERAKADSPIVTRMMRSIKNIFNRG